MDSKPTKYSIGDVPYGQSDIRLHINESRLLPHKDVLNECVKLFEKNNEHIFQQYPPESLSLRRQIKNFIKLDSNSEIRVMSGSDDCLRTTIDMCRTLGLKKIVVGMPAYTHFINFAKLSGIEIVYYSFGVRSSSETHYNILDDILNGDELVYICNPNNPSGNIMNKKHIELLLGDHPSSVFLIDEAYIEFASVASAQPESYVKDNFTNNIIDEFKQFVEDNKISSETIKHVVASSDIDPDLRYIDSMDEKNTNTLYDFVIKMQSEMNILSSAPLTSLYENIIVSRTFSKAFGIAGMRVGYMIANTELMNQIDVAISPKSVNIVSSTAAEAVLLNITEYYSQIVKTNAIKHITVKALKMEKRLVIDTPANFFLLYVENTKAVLKIMSDQKIHIRDRDCDNELKGFVRISIGTITDMGKFIAAMTRVPYPEELPLLINITPKDHILKLKQLYREVAYTLNIVFGIKIWLTGGSLLGYYRLGGILPYDNDIDMGYVIKNKAADPLNSKISIETFEEKDIILSRNRTGCYWQFRYKDNEDIYIDLFPFVKSDGKYVNCDPRYANNGEKENENTTQTCGINPIFTQNELFPLQNVNFCGEIVRVPNKSIKILHDILGDNWKTDIKIRGKTKTYSDVKFIKA